jgi:hypothetical protein
MSTLFPAQRRRSLVLGLVVILLHWTVLGWLNGQIGRDGRRVDAERQTAYAQLVPAEPAPVPPPARPLPVREQPLPQPAPPPPPPVGLPAEPEATLAEAGAPPGTPGGSPGTAGQGGAASGPGRVESLTSAQPAPAPPPATPAAPETRSYRADLPPSANLSLDVDRVDADGTRWTGEAELGWKLGQGGYHAKVEVGIRLLFARVNLLVLTSEGTTGEAGFAPALMTEKRRGRALTATHFNRDEGTITFSASQNKYPLAAGAQDKATVPLQLAAIARADPAQLKDGIDLQVGEDRDATVFHFVVLGEEDVETRLGRLRTLHLSRPPRPGSYNSRLDVWLAPEKGWLPVKIKNTEASGAVTTQTVNKIVMTDTGS